ncbi:hypothetical protein [Pantoea sp. CCBC3-3-1]|uniref:hypothetical protein n=1 Tax=Pantoea sp. CCBC3-3-1 TaxID=2490851 RepID=UPI0011BD8B02|nr:hypothetical protein [Pantoea sp. CCBC3-3-1]
MTKSTTTSLQLFNDRSLKVSAELERRPYLTIHDVINVLGKGISVARQLVRDMEACGQLVIIYQGSIRLYFREEPTPDQIPTRIPRTRNRDEPPSMVFLRTSQDRRGNTRCDECRQSDQLHHIFSRLVSLRHQTTSHTN